MSWREIAWTPPPCCNRSCSSLRSLRSLRFIPSSPAENVGAPPKIATAARASLLPIAYAPPFSHPLRRQASLVPHAATPAPLSRFSSLTWGQDGPEPKAVAPTHTGRARCATTRVSLRATRIRTMPIPTPLPNIPRHVIQAIPVCRKISHRTRVGTIASGEGRMIAMRRVDIVGVAPSRQGVSVVVRLTP